MGYDISYRLSPSVQASYSFMQAITNFPRFTFNSIGIEWSKRITGFQKPLYIQTGLSIFHSTSGAGFAKTNSTSFEIARKQIDSEKIIMVLGEKKVGIMPTLKLVYKFKPKISVFTKMELSVFSSSRQQLLIAEASGSIMNRKKAVLKTNSDGLAIINNGVLTEFSGTRLNNLKPMLSLGIRIGL